VLPSGLTTHTGLLALQPEPLATAFTLAMDFLEKEGALAAYNNVS